MLCSKILLIGLPTAYRLTFILPALVFGFLGAWGQPAPADRPNGEGTPSPAGFSVVAPLHVGEIMPPVTATPSLPHQQNIAIPQTGKLTILYYWRTSCTNCWFKFPALNALQKKYGNRLNIVTITPENFNMVQSFMGRTEKLKDNQLPVVTNDSTFDQYFPHTLISHVVWLNDTGKVLAITWSDYVTEENIDWVLAGHNPPWRVKADYVQYDGSNALLSFNRAAGYNIVPEKPAYFFWSRVIHGLDAKLYRVNDSLGNRTTAINTGFKTLISIALGGSPFHLNRYAIPDTLLPYLFRPENMYYDDWLDRYATCFEMYLPADYTSAEAQTALKDAVESRLKIQMSYDSTEVAVWEITGNPLTPKSNKETFSSRLYAWNFSTPFPLVSIPELAKSGYLFEPDTTDLANFQALEAWAKRNGFTATQTTQKLRILKIQPKL
jgi:thiol-disulfide isomerase/thioredoxin